MQHNNERHQTHCRYCQKTLEGDSAEEAIRLAQEHEGECPKNKKPAAELPAAPIVEALWQEYAVEIPPTATAIERERARIAFTKGMVATMGVVMKAVQEEPFINLLARIKSTYEEIVPLPIHRWPS